MLGGISLEEVVAQGIADKRGLHLKGRQGDKFLYVNPITNEESEIKLDDILMEAIKD